MNFAPKKKSRNLRPRPTATVEPLVVSTRSIASWTEIPDLRIREGLADPAIRDLGPRRDRTGGHHERFHCCGGARAKVAALLLRCEIHGVFSKAPVPCQGCGRRAFVF